VDTSIGTQEDNAMARKPNARILDAGDPFPALELTLTDGKRLRLPADLTHPFNVVLVNRGAWCPFCTMQLKAFQMGLSKLVQEGIGVISLSTDTHEKASAAVTENRLEFPVAYGASVDAVAEALGVFYDPKPMHTPPYFHSAGFVLAPGGKVLNAVYSSGAIGRLVWQDVLGLVQYVKSQG
jgi:peroxiredoxin